MMASRGCEGLRQGASDRCRRRALWVLFRGSRVGEGTQAELLAERRALAIFNRRRFSSRREVQPLINRQPRKLPCNACVAAIGAGFYRLADGARTRRLHPSLCGFHPRRVSPHPGTSRVSETADGEGEGMRRGGAELRVAGKRNRAAVGRSPDLRTVQASVPWTEGPTESRKCVRSQRSTRPARKGSASIHHGASRCMGTKYSPLIQFHKGRGLLVSIVRKGSLDEIVAHTMNRLNDRPQALIRALKSPNLDLCTGQASFIQSSDRTDKQDCGKTSL